MLLECNCFQRMQESPRHKWPHLYLYSSADVLVPINHIEDMADSRVKAGVKCVLKHDFRTSAHVMHFKAFPNVYRKFCVDFVRKCLGCSEEDKVAENQI